eukprot:212376_1
MSVPLMNMFILLVQYIQCEQLWKAQKSVMDVPWNTNVYEENITINCIDNVSLSYVLSKLNGAYFQNGPAIWRYIPDDENINVLFGLAMIRSFKFNNGKISFHVSMVNDSYYQHFYNINHNTSNIHTTNSSYMEMNTQVTVRMVNNNILLFNGAYTVSNQIDPITLSTIQSPYIYNDNLSIYGAPPHAQIDPYTKEIFHMYYDEDLLLIDNLNKTIYYQLYNIKPNTSERIITQHKIFGANKSLTVPLQHMNGLTKNYYILCKPTQVTMKWIVIDRYHGEIIAEFSSNKFAYFHYANCYEFFDAVSNRIYVIVDLVIWQNSTDNIMRAFKVDNILYHSNVANAIQATTNISRFILPINDSNNAGIIEPILLCKQFGLEFPIIYYQKYNSLPYKYIYA